MATIFDLQQKNNKAGRFETLIRPHAIPLYQFAYRLTGNEADAEDIVQDVFIKLFPKTVQMTFIDKLRPWLMRVLYNQFVDTKRQAARSAIDLRHNDQNVGENALEQLVDDNANPVTQLDNAHQSALLTQALNSLNDDQRALVHLYLIEGHTLKEASVILDVPLGTIKSRLDRAKSKLKMSLTMEPLSQK